MARSVLRPRLTAKERRILEMAIQGASLDSISATLNQSPKVIGRCMHEGIKKLESWTAEAAPGPQFHSRAEQSLGFFPPRDAERRIDRVIRNGGSPWACIVVLCMPPDRKETTSESMIEGLSRHIANVVRRSDIVTKWSKTEWVIFLPSITREQSEAVVKRLHQNVPSLWPLAIRANHHDLNNVSFVEVATACHRQVMAEWVNRDLGAWTVPGSPIIL